MIHARGLGHTFHTRHQGKPVETRAVDGIDLDVADGEIVAVLGPNGAGKTTTLRILTTLLRPDEGTATVAGFDVATQAQQVRRSIGYVSQSGSTFSQARAGEEVVDHGLLYGRTRAEVERRGRELFDQLDLPGMWTRQPKSMSGGQRRRLDIAMGLIHDPALVFLDEPTTGLDPRSRTELWEVLRGLVNDGTTLLLTTQYLEEADQLADDIVVVDHGRIIEHGTALQLKERAGAASLVLTVSHAEDLEAAADVLRRTGNEVFIETNARQVTTAADGLGDLTTAAGWLDESGIAVDDLGLARPSLDDVFLSLTGRRTESEDTEQETAS